MSSLAYNDLLKPYDQKGSFGEPEIFDDEATLDGKLQQFEEILKAAQSVVVLTGAGISTSCGIPDFRGPKGVWTLESKGIHTENIKLEEASPSFTHRFLVELEKMNKLDWLITQNIDNLHTRSGFPLNKMAQLHGNLFTEKCQNCQRIYYRDSVILSVGFKPTGRDCEGTPLGRSCRGKLIDNTLDWDSDLPAELLEYSEKMLAACDLFITLGSSLKVQPVSGFPLYAKKKGAKVVNVNLQETSIDSKADLVIHAKVDDVLKSLADKMKINVPLQVESTFVEKSAFHVYKKPKVSTAKSEIPAKRAKLENGESSPASNNSVPSLEPEPKPEIKKPAPKLENDFSDLSDDDEPVKTEEDSVAPENAVENIDAPSLPIGTTSDVLNTEPTIEALPPIQFEDLSDSGSPQNLVRNDEASNLPIGTSSDKLEMGSSATSFADMNFVAPPTESRIEELIEDLSEDEL